MSKNCNICNILQIFPVWPVSTVQNEHIVAHSQPCCHRFDAQRPLMMMWAHICPNCFRIMIFWLGHFFGILLFRYFAISLFRQIPIARFSVVAVAEIFGQLVTMKICHLLYQRN